MITFFFFSKVKVEKKATVCLLYGKFLEDHQMRFPPDNFPGVIYLGLFPVGLPVSHFTPKALKLLKDDDFFSYSILKICIFNLEDRRESDKFRVNFWGKN